MPAAIWRVGLVGTGYWSENHLRAWQSLPNARITALCDRDPERLREKAERYGVPEARRFTDFAAMLAAGADIDVVDIVTGPETHRELVESAAKAGKHILCQKPLAPTLEEAEAMARSCQGAGVRLMVAENWRWMPPFQSIRRALDTGAAGAVRMVRYRHRAWYTPRMEPGAADLPQPFLREMPRLLFFEMGAHWFDTWRFLFGTPRHLYAEARRVSPHIAGEDTGVVVLSHDDFFGFLDMSWASREDRDDSAGETGIRAGFVEEMVIEGDRGTLVLSSTGRRRGGTLTLRQDEGAETVLDESLRFDNAAAHLPLQAHFLDCLATGAPFQTSAEDNLKTLRMAFATYESIATRSAVSL